MPKFTQLGGANHSGQGWYPGEEKGIVSPPDGDADRQKPANSERAIAAALTPKQKELKFHSPFEIAQYIVLQIQNNKKIKLDASRILNASKLKPAVKEKVGEYLAELLDE